MSEDGLILSIVAVNKKGICVHPYIKGKRNSEEKGFEITLTGSNKDYHLVTIKQLVAHINAGDFDDRGRVRMKPRLGGIGSGFAINKATIL